jgi:hypothetical protein
MGLIISNSEVGLGALEVRPLIYRLVCSNGMAVPKDMGSSIRRTHRGAKQDVGILYSEETIRLEGQMIGHQVRDILRTILSEDMLHQYLAKLKNAKEQEINGKIPKVIEELGKTVGFTQNEGDGILRRLVEGGELNRFGMVNAVTADAQDNELSYDRASHMELLGGKILELPQRQWNSISQAA